MIATSAAPGSSSVDKPQTVQAGDGTDWPVNAGGQTYGSAAAAKSPADEPDLILVYATNGKLGYSLRTDLEGDTPSTPEEALAEQAARAGKGVTVPVYLSDGKTQIGEFDIGGTPHVEESSSSH